jgi:hypothetical protein
MIFGKPKRRSLPGEEHRGGIDIGQVKDSTTDDYFQLKPMI